MPWLKRVQGGAIEVFDGVETHLGEAFEVSAELAASVKDDARFAKPTAAQVKAAKVKAAKTEAARLAALDEPEEDS